MSLFAVCAVIMRKFLVVLTSAFIGNRPVFAATAIVLVLFIAYALQVCQYVCLKRSLAVVIAACRITVSEILLLAMQTKFMPYRQHITGEPGTMTGNLVDLTKAASDASVEKSTGTSRLAGSTGSHARKHKDGEEGNLTFALSGRSALDEDKSEPKHVDVGDPRGKVAAGVNEFKLPNRSLVGRLLTILSLGKADKLNVRFEARKGGKTKIKTSYLQDYNLLESTFLTASIIILLCGIMFKAAQLPPG